MEKFVVSARKYRPQNFNTVVGQSHITTTLKNAIKQNHLAHAFLFCGPRGVGKTTCARILAKTINCLNQTAEGEACNTCTSCVSFDAGGSMNIHELDAASNNSVDDIRSLVDQVRFAPQAGKYKVYIVDEVHMLSASAFNAFLKTLEEPPSYAIFILATTEKHKILPTIISRCQIFDFKRITTNDTVEHLEEIIQKEHIQAEKAALQVIAQKSEGCMRDALSILDKIVSFTSGVVNYQNTLEHLNILDHDYYFKLLEALKAQDMASAILLYDQINKKGFEGDIVLNGFAEFMRNILVCKDARAAVLLDVVEGMEAKYHSLASSIDTGYLISALNILNEAEMSYKMARNKRLHVELAIIKLNFLQQAIQVALQDGNIVKKKRIDTPIALRYKPVPSLQINQSITSKEVSPTGKLYVEEKKNIYQAIPVENKTFEPKQKELEKVETIAIESKVLPAKDVASPSISIANLNGNNSSNSLLDALRSKYGEKYSIEQVVNPIPLDEASLKTHWDYFTNKLKSENKVSQANAFVQATISVVDDINFTISVNSALQQKFIEQEKAFLSEYLQKEYCNRLIVYSFIIIEGEKEVSPLSTQLNNKQKFERIAEQYPLLRTLRDNLKLEIDY